jgi:hypothetical protein
MSTATQVRMHVNTQAEVAELLAQHEDALERLYRVYTGALPQHREVWASMAAEEADHARWLRDLAARAGDGVTVVDPGPYSLQSLRSSLEFVKGQVTKARSGGLSALEALSIGMDLESALTEGKLYEAFQDDSDEVKRVCRALANSAAQHRARIQDIWEQARQAEGSPV